MKAVPTLLLERKKMKEKVVQSVSFLNYISFYDIRGIFAACVSAFVPYFTGFPN